MKKLFQVSFVSLLVLFSFNFFEATFLRSSMMNYLTFLYLLTAVVMSLSKFFFEKSIGFVLPVQLLFVSIFFSLFMAFNSWDQSLFDGLISTMPYLIWIFFFYLLSVNFSVKNTEIIILVYGSIYILLYFFQLANSHTVYFGNFEEYVESRGVIRIIFPGGGVLFLSAFMAANKLTTEKKYKILWFTLTFFGLAISVLQATRQFILGVLIIYLFHFTKKMAFYKRVILTGFIGLGVLLYISRSDSAIAKGLTEAQEQVSEQQEDYIRVVAANYFMTDFSPRFMCQVFGNGAARYGISDYGRFIERLADTYGYYIDDLGLIGMYAMFGIFPVIAFILIWIKSFTIPLPEEYYYLKYYIWFLLITSVTSYNVYHPHYLICTVLVLFIYQSIIKRTIKVKDANDRSVKLVLPENLKVYEVEQAKKSKVQLHFSNENKLNA